jgi:single-stranded-DNA-specific exonuclease
MDAFHRPAIVLSVEDGVAHGSCRSFSRFDMLGALERCAHLLTRFGGHKQAAGLTLDASRIRELRLAVNAVADETLGPDDLMPRLRIDGGLAFREITGGVAAGIMALAPFGAGNPRPVFAARGVEIIDGPRKLKERHPQDVAQAGRDGSSAPSPGAPPSATTSSPSTRPRSTSPSPSSRTSTMGTPTSSSPWLTSSKPRT